MFAGYAIFLGEVHWGTRCLMFAGDAVFPGEVHWGTRCPMFAGDAIFPGEVHWGTRCPMFAGNAVFPGEVHCGTRCPRLPGLDKECEELVCLCHTCQVNRSSPPSAPLQPLGMAHTSLGETALGLCWPFLGSMFLVLIDAPPNGLKPFVSPQPRLMPLLSVCIRCSLSLPFLRRLSQTMLHVLLVKHLSLS